MQMISPPNARMLSTWAFGRAMFRIKAYLVDRQGFRIGFDLGTDRVREPRYLGRDDSFARVLAALRRDVPL
jgi:hypothetical protein